MYSKFRNIFPIAIGNMFEAYDFCLYGLLAPIIARNFFPTSFKYSLLGAFLIFSVAYISRPLGACIWGYIADKYGRKPVLIATLSMMALTTITISFLPTYNSIGISACIIVLLLRLFQGITFGGEFPTVMVSMFELAPKHLKGLYGSLADGFAIVGYLVALLVLIIIKAILSEEQMIDWGWRLMFGISILLIGFIGYIRINLIETSKSEIEVNHKNPLLLAINHNWKIIIKLTLYMLAPCCLFFNFLFYTYLIIQTNEVISEGKALMIQIFVVLYSVFLIPLAGFISDKINRFKFVKYSNITLIIICIPMYYLLLINIVPYIIIGYAVFGIFVACSVGTFVAIITSQTHQNCRVSIIAISHSIAVILGSLTPTINELLIKITKISVAPSFYVIVCVGVSLFCLRNMSDNQKNK